jgi:hypothetical protein
MRLVLAVFLCLFLDLNAFPQAEENTKNSTIGVEEIALARGDGSGKAGEATDKFATTDFPIFCFIRLDSEKPAAVKMILVAVKAVGLRPESKIVTVSYTTQANQNQVNFTASPNGVWAAGDYRADVYIDGKLAKIRAFTIETSWKEIKKQITPAPKSLAPRRTVKKSRRN